MSEGGSTVKVGFWVRVSGSTWRLHAEPETLTNVSAEVRDMVYGPGQWSVQGPYDTQTSRVAERFAASSDRGQLVTVDLVRPGGRVDRAMTGLLEGCGPAEDERGLHVFEASGAGALALFARVLAFPSPSTAPNATGAITGQPLRYDASGAAESVLRTLIVANRDRLGLGFTVPASQGRGGTVRVKTKFKDLLSLMQRKGARGGVRMNLGLVNTSGSRAELTLSFSEPQNKAQRAQIDRDTGSLKTWKQSVQPPTASRAVIGGAGKGLDRLYSYIIDASLETLWGWPQEQYVDAREADGGEEIYEAGMEALLSAAAQTSWELDAVEAEGMRWLEHFQVADTVTVRVLPGLQATAPLGAAVISASGGPASVKLVPGNPDSQNPLFRTATVIKALSEQLKGLQREEG